MNKLTKITYSDPVEVGFINDWMVELFAEYETRNPKTDETQPQKVLLGNLYHKDRGCLISIAEDFCSLPTLKQQFEL